MRKKKRIGPNDRLFTWKKPKYRPKGLSKEEDDSVTIDSNSSAYPL